MQRANGVLLSMLVLATPLVCRSDSPPQQQPSFDIVMFSRFFGQVAELRPPTQMIHLNGQASDLKHPTLQEAIGLSDREAEVVTAAAVRCEEERSSIERSAGALTLSARLDSIDGRTGNKHHAALLGKRAGIVESAIAPFRTALGSNPTPQTH